MKKLILFLSLLLIIPVGVWALMSPGMGGQTVPSGSAGIAHDANSSGGAHNTTTITISHTCSAGSNRMLFVGGCGSVQGEDPTGITYAGNAMTKIWDGLSSGNTANFAYYIINPSTGANNIVVTFADATGTRSAGGVSFTGVDQSSPFDAAAGFTSTFGTSVNTNVSSATNDCVIDVMTQGSDTNATEGANQTKRVDISQFGLVTYISTKAGEATCNMSWSWSGDTWGNINGISINPAT